MPGREEQMNDYDKQRRASETAEQREERREMASLRRHSQIPEGRQRQRTVKRN